MKTELLGMSDDKLIQWASKHGRFTVDELKKQLPKIELLCAQYSVSLRSCVEKLVEMSDSGIGAAEAGEILRRSIGALGELQ